MDDPTAWLAPFNVTYCELGYEGVSIDQVLEQRLRRTAYGPHATAATVLGALENATLYLRNRRLADELGSHAVGRTQRRRRTGGAAPCTTAAGVLPHQ
jgi:hypothetical protein